MGFQEMAILAFVPAAVVLSFFLHWLTLLRVNNASERLPLCRGAYLALSGQLVLYSWAVFAIPAGCGAAVCLVSLGMTFSFFGDIFNLQFPAIAKKTGEPLFFGIISFMAAQVCYIAAFLLMVPVSELAQAGHLYPLLAVLVIVPAILFKFRVYNPGRPKRIMMGALVYGFILGAMAAVAISAALARGGLWYFPALGAAFFLLSDAVMGETTVHGRHPVFEFQVPWVTYLIAQGLIIFGFAALAGSATV